MKKSLKININRWIFTILLLFLWTGTGLTISMSDSWGISREEVIKTYFQGDEKYTEFTISDKPDYQNKILSYIVAIDSDLKRNIKILRSSNPPERDFLFVGDKLYSILINHGTIDINKHTKIIDEITGIYGKPSLQKDSSISIYSFKDKKTKVLVLSSAVPGGLECKVYYYANSLFRMLITH